MEVVVSQQDLSFALANTSRITTSRAGLPILGNILLRTEKNKLLIASTNLEVASSHRITAKITKPGSITIPAKLISEFIQNLSKEQLTLNTKDSKLYITAAGSASTINGTNDDEFPELPTSDDKTAIKYTITNQDFKQAVTQTIGAASSDTTRPILTGTYWHSFNKMLYLAATDGYRLAERSIVATKSDINAVIPATTLQEVLRTLRDETQEIEVLFDETQVTFRFDNIEITSRLIDGTFPDYRQLIPEDSDTNFTINRSEFIRIIKIANLFARESGGGIILTIDSDKPTLIVNSIASEIGENSSEVDVNTTGSSGSISLNSRYILDALNVMSSDEIAFGFSGKLAPCVLQEVEKQPTYKHIIMPLKS